MNEQEIKHLKKIISQMLISPLSGEHVQITAILKKQDLDLLQKISKL
jgi:hypothetical protein